MGEAVDKQAVANVHLSKGGGQAAVRLDELRELRAVPAPSPAQRERIEQLAAGEEADKQAVADFKLSSGGGQAAVRLNELKELRAVPAPSPAQRERIAQLATVVD